MLQLVIDSVMESTLTSQGQATIPKAVRERLHLKPGDKVRFFFHPDGSVAILPVLPITALKGMLKSPYRRALTIEEMNEGLSPAARRRLRR